MFSLFKKSQSDALAPIVELARNCQGYDRTVFLSELRRDAPTVATMVEQLLLDEASRHAVPMTSTMPATASARIRQEVRLDVALTDVSALSTTG